MKWYRKAAEQGLARAQWKLGDCFCYGHGVAEDEPEAVNWYRKAAEQEPLSSTQPDCLLDWHSPCGWGSTHG